MIFRQFYLDCLAHASYLIGDESTHVAAVVDPQRDITCTWRRPAAMASSSVMFFSLTFMRTSLPVIWNFAIGRELRSILVPRRAPSIRSSR